MNIWQTAKYLNPDRRSVFDKILPLVRRDRSSTTDKTEQAKELLATFFPPTICSDRGGRPTTPVGPSTNATALDRRGRAKSICSIALEGTRRRWTASNGIEAGIASSEREGASPVPDVTGRGRASSRIEKH
jgi:hypothetical protein